MRLPSGIIFGLLLFLFSIAWGDTINIPGDYPYIQYGINASVNGDVVLVAPGTYLEHIDFKGKAITLKSSDGAERTVIDGYQWGRVVAFKAGEGPDSILDGFTIFNGYTTGHGGGIFCLVGSSPTIVNNLITKNRAGYGGGIHCSNSNPFITNNRIIDNGAEYGGGGIHCSKCDPIITNNIIIGNKAYWHGGGIGSSGSPTIAGNRIDKNKVNFEGGGIYCGEGSPIITGNSITGNTATRYGGGIYCSHADPFLTNNTIVDNSGDWSGGGILCANSRIKILNTILRNNYASEGTELYIYGGSPYPSTVEISYSNVDKSSEYSIYVASFSTLNWGDGMIDIDPLFVEQVNGDYHLTFDSPCRDTGNNQVVTELFDFEGDPRIAWDGTVDMGADEFYTHLYVEGYKTPGGRAQERLIGLPGTSPVYLFIGSGVRPTPVPTPYGDFHLLPPNMLIPLVPVPANGVLSIPNNPITIPPNIPAPYDVPMQALVGLDTDSLTNLCVLEVR